MCSCRVSNMSRSNGPTIEFHFKNNPVELLNLPWSMPLEDWKIKELIKVERGLSRHVVRFVELDTIYAIKELPNTLAKKEFDLLVQLNELELPVVEPVGYVLIKSPFKEDQSMIITKYLEYSIPYRSLFMRHGLSRYQERLIDALAILLVNIHLNGFFWGDCSLSNVLFRRDAGELQAYLVDAETSEIHPTISDQMREYDLEILETNIWGDLSDLSQIVDLPKELAIKRVGKRISDRYHVLWKMITEEVIIDPNQRYKIQDYIKVLNELGFTIDEIQLVGDDPQSHLHVKASVTDRNYHRHMLQNLTGIMAQENQAQIILNDIHQFKAIYSHQQNRSVPLQIAAHRWLSTIYSVVIDVMQPHIKDKLPPPEVYCQILENKWFLSERLGRDVGFKTAIENYIDKLSSEEVAAQKLGL